MFVRGRCTLQYQQVTAEQVCRFLNSELHYEERPADLLLRAVQVSSRFID